jgi:hypothetical protein
METLVEQFDSDDELFDSDDDLDDPEDEAGEFDRYITDDFTPSQALSLLTEKVLLGRIV